MFTMVVDMFVYVVAALVATGISGVIVMINIWGALVPLSISPPISFSWGILEVLGLH